MNYQGQCPLDSMMNAVTHDSSTTKNVNEIAYYLHGAGFSVIPANYRYDANGDKRDRQTISWKRCQARRMDPERVCEVLRDKGWNALAVVHGAVTIPTMGRALAALDYDHKHDPDGTTDFRGFIGCDPNLTSKGGAQAFIVTPVGYVLAAKAQGSISAPGVELLGQGRISFVSGPGKCLASCEPTPFEALPAATQALLRPYLITEADAWKQAKGEARSKRSKWEREFEPYGLQKPAPTNHTLAWALMQWRNSDSPTRVIESHQANSRFTIRAFRNETIHRLALSLYQYLMRERRTGALTCSDAELESAVEAELLSINLLHCEPSKHATEVVTTARSAMSYTLPDWQRDPDKFCRDNMIRLRFGADFERFVKVGAAKGLRKHGSDNISFQLAKSKAQEWCGIDGKQWLPTREQWERRGINSIDHDPPHHKPKSLNGNIYEIAVSALRLAGSVKEHIGSTVRQIRDKRTVSTPINQPTVTSVKVSSASFDAWGNIFARQVLLERFPEEPLSRLRKSADEYLAKLNAQSSTALAPA